MNNKITVKISSELDELLNKKISTYLLSLGKNITKSDYIRSLILNDCNDIMTDSGILYHLIISKILEKNKIKHATISLNDFNKIDKLRAQSLLKELVVKKAVVDYENEEYGSFDYLLLIELAKEDFNTNDNKNLNDFMIELCDFYNNKDNYNKGYVDDLFVNYEDDVKKDAINFGLIAKCLNERYYRPTDYARILYPRINLTKKSKKFAHWDKVYLENNHPNMDDEDFESVLKIKIGSWGNVEKYDEKFDGINNFEIYVKFEDYENVIRCNEDDLKFLYKKE